MPIEDEAVRDAFVQWVSLQTAPPPNPAMLIDHIELSHDYAGLLESEIHGRRALWKSVPASARTRVTLPAEPTDAVDAWTADAVALRRQSIHISACTTCGGDKKVSCEACGGAGKIACSACNGQRKAYGYTSAGAYRLLNCTLCRGKGEVDCLHCRRGIATCSTCAGEGRLQRWLEIESWQRSAWKAYPGAFEEKFSWPEPLTNDAIARDAELAAELSALHALTRDDIGGLPPGWLDVLRPDLTADERIAQQRLRIARVPLHTVHYRLGSRDGRMRFVGLRLLRQAESSDDPFARRGAQLRRLRIVLVLGAAIVTIASFARGAFFFSFYTAMSLAACCTALIAIYAAVADWTAARLRAQMRAAVAATAFVVAILFAFLALPRAARAEKLIDRGDLDGAEAELRALNVPVTSPRWADLLLARIHKSSAVADATSLLGQIPATLPQHDLAAGAVDDLVLRTASDQMRKGHSSDAAATLAQLSDRGRIRPEATVIARSACLPSARERIDRRDWNGAADAIAVARRAGVAPHDLEPLGDAIREAAIDAAAKARQSADASSRLERRLAAEAMFVAWERSSETWATPALIALRTAMAQDIAALEHARRRAK